MRNTRIILATVIGALLGFTACAPQQPGVASSDSYPDKPISLIVPFDPGGGTDLTARVIADALSDELGVPVNVLNKPGAEAIAGVNALRTSRADGYTLLADGAGSSSLQSFSDNVPFDWDDRTFIGRVTSGAHAYAVPADSPYKTLDDLIAALKADPSSFRVNWAGGGTTTDLTTLSLLKQAGVKISDLKGIPFSSSGETMEALAGGDLDFGVGGASATFSLASSDDIRVLAHTGTQPIRQLPDAPSTAEAGHAELDVTFWVGISAPADLPASVKERLENALEKIVEDPDVLKQLSNVGVATDILVGEDFDEYVHTEVDTFKMLRESVGQG